MSTTQSKRAHAEALADAMAFRELFDGCYDEWHVAGSIRRNKPEVGDIEHVIVPRFGDVPTGGLFSNETARVNLVWHKLESLLGVGDIDKHRYGEIRSTRWGDLYRGVDFRGFNHELFTADADNLGAILAIRTGPADYSQALVTRLKDGGMYRQSGGYVVHVKSGERVPVRTEEAFFKLCRLPYVEPEKRLG